MVPLPLILEQTTRWLLVAVPLGGALLGLLGYAVWKCYRAGWAGIGPRAVASWLFMGGLGALLMLQSVGWQLRMDRDGVTLTAPFDVFSERGTIAWPELRVVRFGWTGGRHSYPTVEFVSRFGKVLVLPALDGVPDAYWPAMMTAVEDNTLELMFGPDKARWLASVRSKAQPEAGSLRGVGYVARDGSGKILE